MPGEIPPINNTTMNTEENAFPLESQHEPQVIPPPEAILGVSTEEVEIAESPIAVIDTNAKRVIAYINALAENDRKREIAEADFYGSRKGDARQWGGLKQARTNLENRTAYLANVDERILNTEELASYREEKIRVNQNLSNITPDAEYAKDFLINAEKDINVYTELSLNDFASLPEELQGAIRTENQSVFKKYGVDSWGARQINRALKIHEKEDEEKQREAEHHIEGLLERKKTGKTTWQDVASVLDTSNFALFSGAEIKKILVEQGITEDGVRILRERYLAETKKQEYKPDTLRILPRTRRATRRHHNFGDCCGR